jgi:hypothetical protein
LWKFKRLCTRRQLLLTTWTWRRAWLTSFWSRKSEHTTLSSSNRFFRVLLDAPKYYLKAL